MTSPAQLRIEVTEDVPTCQALRRVVFIDEQGVSEADEVDGMGISRWPPPKPSRAMA